MLSNKTQQLSKFKPLSYFKSTALILLILSLSGCSSHYVDNRASSPHFKDGIFHNGISPDDRNWWDVIKMRLSNEWADWPDSVPLEKQPSPVLHADSDSIRLTVINHATVLIQTENHNILTDPVYSKRVSPFSFVGPKRVIEPGISFDELPKIDAIIISHDHYDHLDLATIERLRKRDNPLIYVGLGVGERLDSTDNVIEMDWWQKEVVAKDLEISFVPVQHFSGRGLFDQFTTLWGGYVIETQGQKIYFGGDSGYASHYKKTYEAFGAMDISILPIGAYSPRSFMAYIHMDPKQAVQAHLDLRSKQSIGVHYGTFQLTAEPIDEPEKLLKEEIAKAGLDEADIVTLPFGKPQTFHLNVEQQITKRH